MSEKIANSRLGRNPLFKKRKSAVSSLMEDRPHVPTEIPVHATDLFKRVKQMNIEVRWSQVLGRLYGRIRKPTI
jgi:hypothetical protein